MIAKLKLIYRNVNLTFQPKAVNIMLKPNGSGKTTIIDAVRYGLTGTLPKGRGQSADAVIGFTSGRFIERRCTDGRTTSFVNGKRSTEAAVNEVIKEETGVPVQDLKITSSAEVLASLKPDEFLGLLMKYIPEDIDADTVTGYFHDPSEKTVQKIRELFPPMPEKFGIQAVNDAFQKASDARKELNGVIKNKRGAYAELSPTEPKRGITEIDADMANLMSQNRDALEAERKWTAYQEAKKKRAEQDEETAKLKKKVAELKDVVPTEAQRRQIVAVMAKWQSKKETIAVALGKTKKDIQRISGWIENISGPTCPYSSKITCTVDKTPVREEMEEKKAELEKKAEDESKAADLANQMLEKCARNMDQWNELKQKSIEYQKAEAELGWLEKNLVSVPEKPEEPKTDEELKKKAASLSMERQNCLDWETKNKLAEEIKQAGEDAEILNTICTALKDKGEVKTEIVKYYLSAFEQAANDRADKYAPGFSINFRAENGVAIYVKPPMGNGYYPIYSLSSGEKIMAALVITDMLNQLAHSGMLFIDNIEQLDMPALEKLAETLRNEEFRKAYEMIFVMGVDHDDVKAAMADVK